MQIIVDEECTNKDLFDSFSNQIENILIKFIEPFSLTTLKYFVISDTDADKFYNTLRKHAKYLNTEIAYGDSEMYLVAGKSIEGVDAKGNYSQVIVVKSGLILGMISDLNYLCDLSIDEKPAETNIQWIGMTTIIHELGHAIDNEIIFKQKHTVDLRCAYDLSNEDERNKYFKNSAISLWGEFFAESFVYIACPELRNLAKSKTSDLLNCIDNYRGIGVSPIDRAYRILYLFTHIIAQSGKPGFDYSVLNINEQYIHFLKTVELELFRILEKYPEVNIASDFDIINKEFYDLCIFEYKQHI